MIVARFWVCVSERFVRWESSEGEQFLAHLVDGCASGPDADLAPEWLVDEALAALSDSGTRSDAFAGFDASWSAAADAMNASHDARHGEAA